MRVVYRIETVYFLAPAGAAASSCFSWRVMTTEAFHADVLVESEVVDGYIDLLFQVFGEGLYLEGFHLGNELTAVFYALGCPGEMHRNVGNHFFVFYEFQQIDVDEFVTHLVELQVFHDGAVHLPVDFYFGDLEVRCVNQLFETNLLRTPVNYTGHHVLRADLTGG